VTGSEVRLQGSVRNRSPEAIGLVLLRVRCEGAAGLVAFNVPIGPRTTQERVFNRQTGRHEVRDFVEIPSTPPGGVLRFDRRAPAPSPVTQCDAEIAGAGEGGADRR